MSYMTVIRLGWHKHLLFKKVKLSHPEQHSFCFIYATSLYIYIGDIHLVQIRVNEHCLCIFDSIDL